MLFSSDAWWCLAARYVCVGHWKALCEWMGLVTGGQLAFSLSVCRSLFSKAFGFFPNFGDGRYLPVCRPLGNSRRRRGLPVSTGSLFLSPSLHCGSCFCPALCLIPKCRTFHPSSISSGNNLGRMQWSSGCLGRGGGWHNEELICKRSSSCSLLCYSVLQRTETLRFFRANESAHSHVNPSTPALSH